MEGFRASAVKLRNGHRSYTTALQGMSEPADLKRVLDASLQPVPMPNEGLLLTDYLAELLAVRPGDLLEVFVGLQTPPSAADRIGDTELIPREALFGNPDDFIEGAIQPCGLYRSQGLNHR